MRTLTSLKSGRTLGLLGAAVILSTAQAGAQIRQPDNQPRFQQPTQVYRSSQPQPAAPDTKAPQPAPTPQVPAMVLQPAPAAVAAPQPALPRAASEQNAAACMNEARTTTAEQSIGGCNAVIQETAKNLATAYFFRAVAYRSKNEFDRAIADFGQAIALDPTDAEYFINRAATYEAKKETDRAVADYDQAIKLNPKSVNAFNYRGAAFQRKGDYARAAADYGEVTKLQPANAEAWSARCWVRAAGGRETQQALTDCNEALKIRANAADTFDTRGFVYLKLGQFDAALKDYDAALRIEPKLAGSLYGRGIAKQKKGDRSGGNTDIAAAKAIRADIADEFSRYGVR
jgi:tetratricopeptide (TPR) repeat protein